MRRHGWGGDLPADDAEARERILEAAVGVVRHDQPATLSVSRVAADVGITRQTLYRYFADSEDLLRHVEARVGAGLVQRMLDHCAQFDDREERFAETLVFLARELPKDPVLRKYFAPDNASMVFSDVAMDYSLMHLQRLLGSWPRGLTEEKRRGVAEVFLRLLFSLVLVPQSESDTRHLKTVSFSDVFVGLLNLLCESQ